MPNHCHNRVTFYSDDSTAILKLHKIWLSGIENDDDSETRKTVFGHFIPNQTGQKFPLLKKTLKSIHSQNLKVTKVNCQSLKIRDSDQTSILNLLAKSTTDGITGEFKTGERSGIAIP